MVDFQLCSDLHIEMRGGLSAGVEAYPRPVAPILVLAGDLYPSGAPEFTEVLRRATEGFHLALYVPGNHEYYGCTGSMGELEAMVARKANSVPNVLCLNRQTLNIGDMAFIGATGWTNPPKSKWKHGPTEFNDYRAIKKSKKNSPEGEGEGPAYTPADLCAVHKAHTTFLGGAIATAKRSGAKGAVVVTHHAPDARLSAETGSRPKDLFPYYFATDMGALTGDPFVRVWCHGHSHESHCIRLDPWGALFACNARGYPNERTGYTNDAIVSVHREKD